MAEGYGPDLARVHDEGFGGFARAAAPGLLRLLERAGVRDGLVVDLGCGSGIWAEELVARGYDVLGVDISADLLRIARRRAPQARFVEASFLDADLPRCRAVTALGEVLGYALDPRVRRRRRLPLFRRVHAALEPGGVLVFDLAGPGRERTTPRRTWHEGDDWLLCMEAWEDAEARTLTRRITVFAQAGRGWRRSDEEHVVCLHDPEDVLADLAAAGFDARRLRGYGSGWRFPRGWTGFAAVKPRSPRRPAPARGGA